jgi:hypothetical protein
MSRKGLSDVIVTILIILISMAIIVVVWKFVLPVIEKSSGIGSQIYTTKLSVNPGSVSYDPNTDSVSLNIERGSGQGSIIGFMVGLTDQEGNVKVYRENLTLGEYETKNLQLSYNDLTIDDVLSVTITPIFREETNSEAYGIPIQQPIANKTPYRFPNSLIGHWKFDQDSLCLEYVNSLNCTAVGNANYDFGNKKIGLGSASLGGSLNDYFEAVNDARFTTNAFTIIAWVNPQNLQNGFSNVADRSSSSNGFVLGFDNTSQTWQLQTRNGANRNVVSISDGNANSWQFLAASYDSTESKIYYNTNSSSFNNLYQLQFPTSAFKIGSGFNGNIDEVMFFNRVLTAQEIGNIRRKYKG